MTAAKATVNRAATKGWAMRSLYGVGAPIGPQTSNAAEPAARRTANAVTAIFPLSFGEAGPECKAPAEVSLSVKAPVESDDPTESGAAFNIRVEARSS